MLKSLEIRNYRNLKHLKINKLGRVNLIVGKNNTGKSSVLEAISIFTGTTKFGVYAGYQLLLGLLENRGENYVRGRGSSTQNSKSLRSGFAESNVKSLSSLFTDRKIEFNHENNIFIGDYLNHKSNNLYDFVRVGFTLDKERMFQGQLPLFNENWSGSIPFFFIENNDGISVMELEEETREYTRTLLSKELDKSSIQYVKTNGLDKNVNSELWDKITLTDREQFVIDALKTIEYKIERIAFINSESNGLERRVVARMIGEVDLVPLRSMGDGINRILTIILAMVNCENGYLLIDEFENGLHYSVQEKLWEIIFHLAERLNVQVFATTHSYDCIDAFSEVLNGGKHAKDSGVMIRLDNFKDTIEATVYDANEIQNTTRLHVDPR